MYQSIPSLTIPRETPGDSHILVAPGVGFSLLCLARGVLNQSKSSIILKKSAIFHLSLKQLSSSSFHMFIYARSEQCDLVPIYIIRNTQRTRIYPCKLKFILVKISSDPGQRKPHSIHVSYYWEFIRTPLFTRVQIRSVFRLFVQLCCKFTWVNAFTRWYKRVGAYLGNLIFIHFFLRIHFYPDWSHLRIASKRIKLIRTNIYKVLQLIRISLPSVNGT